MPHAHHPTYGQRCRWFLSRSTCQADNVSSIVASICSCMYWRVRFQDVESGAKQLHFSTFSYLSYFSYFGYPPCAHMPEIPLSAVVSTSLCFGCSLRRTPMMPPPGWCQARTALKCYVRNFSDTSNTISYFGYSLGYSLRRMPMMPPSGVVSKRSYFQKCTNGMRREEYLQRLSVGSNQGLGQGLSLGLRWG